MAEVAYATTADGVAKKKHTKIIKLLPDKRLVVGEVVKYDAEQEIGASIESLTYLTHEHGFTAIGAAGAPQDLEPSAVAESKPALMTPTSVHLTTRITHEILSAASSKGDKAYEKYMDGTMRRLKKAMDLREEVRKLYGGAALCQASAAATEVTATTGTFVISDATFAPLTWIGSRGMRLDAYTAAGTKLNAASAITVTSFTPSTRTIAFTTDATSVDAIVAAGTDCYFYYRSYYGNDGQGLISIASLNASSGNYLSVACGTYADVWTATQQDWDHSTEQFSWTKLNNGIEEAIGHGLDAEELLCFPSFKAWRHLCSNLEALRALDSGYSATKTEVGHEIDSLSYHSVSGAKVTLKPSPCIQRRHVLVMAKPDELNEICMAGSTPPKFGVPGEADDKIVVQIPRTNYVEVSMFGRLGVWAPCPNQFLLFRPAA